MNSVTGGVPDLLRRFVPAPHRASMVFGGDMCASVQANDLQLLTAMQLATTSESFASNPTVCMTIIRDADYPVGGTALTLLSAWPLATLFVGSGTVLTLDGDNREIFAFVAPSVTAGELVNRLLPMLLEPLRSRSDQASVVRPDER